MFRQAMEPVQFANTNQLNSFNNPCIKPPNASHSHSSSYLDRLKRYTSKFEDILAYVMDPIKTYKAHDLKTLIDIDIDIYRLLGDF